MLFPDIFILVNLFRMRIGFYLFVLTACFLTFSAVGQPANWHSTSLQDAWLSCTPLPNPNTSRGAGHWLMYDFGQVYRLTNTHFWNFNTPERTNSYNNESWSLSRVKGKPEDGAKEVIVDYSFDGILWKEWGRFEMQKAPASPFYAGESGPDFGGLQTRYLMLTIGSNHGGSCFGLSEVRFDVQEAPSSVTTDRATNPGILVQPNPFSHESMVTLQGFPEGVVDFQLIDLSGRLLSVQTIHSSGGQSSHLWLPGGHPPGLYILKVVHDKTNATTQVEIIH